MLSLFLWEAPANADTLKMTATDGSGNVLAALLFSAVEEVQPASDVIDTPSGPQVVDLGIRKAGKECVVTIAINPLKSEPPLKGPSVIANRCGAASELRVADLVLYMKTSR